MRDVRERRVNIESLEQRRLLSGASETPVAEAAGVLGQAGTTVQFGGRTVGRYTDSAGTPVAIKLSGPGMGTLEIGPNPEDFQLTLDGTTAASTLSFSTRGTVLGPTQVNGSLGALKASKVVLSDPFTLTGSLDSVQLGGATSGARIDLGAANGALVAKFGVIEDLNLTTPGAIASIKANDWINVDALFDVITAASVGSVKSSGNLRAGINTTGDVLSVKANGELSGIWDVTGNVGAVTAGSASIGWIPNVTGAFSSLKVGSLSATMSLGMVGSVRVTGGFTDGSFEALAIDSFTVGGLLGNSTIRVADRIGAMSVGQIIASTVYVGLSPSTFLLPSDPGEFLIEGASIGSFTAKGTFAGSKLAAQDVGKVSIKSVVPANGGEAHGFAAISLGSFSRTGLKWRAGQDTTELVTPVGDFVVRLLG